MELIPVNIAFYTQRLNIFKLIFLLSEFGSFFYTEGPLFNTTVKHFSIFNSMPTAILVMHATRDFFACYTWSFYSFMLGPRTLVMMRFLWECKTNCKKHLILFILFQWHVLIFSLYSRTFWLFAIRKLFFCHIMTLNAS